MANKFTFPSSQGTALKTRLDKKTLLILIAGVLVVLGLVIGAVILISRDTAEKAPEVSAPPKPEATAQVTPEQRPEATPAPAEAPAPAPAAPVTEPEAVTQVPPDTSSELTGRILQRRDGFPMLSWDTTLFSYADNGRVAYSGGPTLTGVDVSEHQGKIEWDRVAATDIDYAMIRVGYRGSSIGDIHLDEYFEKNISGALAAGVPVGVYFYSQAITVEEAREEARFVLDQIKDYNVTFPVVFDWEIVGANAARTYAVSRQMLCECTRAFCDMIKEAGYDPMIYFTRYLGYRKYILRNLTDYDFWYAEYGLQPRFVFDFDMWQYSDTGWVDGIPGYVDLNIYMPRR